MVKADERVSKYLKSLEDNKVLTSKQMSMIKSVYHKVKPNVVENLYMDIVSVCVSNILDNEDNTTEESLINEVNMTLGLNRNEHEEVALRSLSGIDEVMNEEEDKDKYKAMFQVIEEMKENKDLNNVIFLDILNGESELAVAKKYRLTTNEVKNIFSERLEFVESILIVHGDVIIKDVESREPFKSNVKMLTDNK